MQISKFITAVVLVSIFNSSVVWAGPNDSQPTQNEQTQKDIQQNRQEVNNAVVAPNTPSTPTKVDTSTWGLDSTTQFDITNHLFGYSTILDQDTAYDGVKLTGFFNLAYYSPRKENDGAKKKGRLVVGFEEPVWKISNRTALFLGGGFNIGHASGLYLDAGLDVYIFSWLKTQVGVNFATDNKHTSPQLSIGLVW